jgi:lauroyl/myristoyl acyltransferase
MALPFETPQIVRTAPTSTSDKTIGENARLRSERPSPAAMFIRRRAADFWLIMLFWLSRRSPRFPVKTKPFFFWFTWKFADLMRENTLCNARRLLGCAASHAEHRELARSIIGNFYDFICDVGRSVGQSREQMLERIEGTEGHENYLAARAAGKGAIVVTAHMGSFEVGIVALLEHEKRLHVVFRKDAYGLFERTRSALRQRLGVNEVSVDEGLEVWVRLRDALKNNEVVLVQGDRVMPGQRGSRTALMGGHVMLPTGPAKLALASGAPIIPIFSVRKPDGRIRLFVEPPIWVQSERDVEPALAKLAAILEAYLRRFPDQWLMIHRAWCEDQATARAAL